MTVQINSNYLENYSSKYAQLACEKFFSSRQFITGQDIIQLTSSTQVNFFIIKCLFELWQEELAKLKGSPYFDYRDIAVHDALTQFMNVLSRRIKVERSNLEPLVKAAVSQAIQVATDPVSFYQKEIGKAPQGKINEFLRENKKYYKWNDKVVSFLIDKTGFGHDSDSYLRAIAANYHVVKDSLESVNLLLATLGDIKAFDVDLYLGVGQAELAPVSKPASKGYSADGSLFDAMEKEIPMQKSTPIATAPIEELISVSTFVAMEKDSISSIGHQLNASKLKAYFASESYKGMKGIMGALSESLALNQRFMFTKELFHGNADLLRHALKSIDEAGSFTNAVDLINSRFVSELGWEINSEAVEELMQLVYRKYSD